MQPASQHTPNALTDPSPHVPVIPPPRFFFVASVCLLAAFVVWSLLVFNVDAMQAFDRQCAQHWRAQSNAYPGALGAMVFFTDLGSIATMTILTVMGAIWQTAINRRVLAVAWIGIAFGVAFLNQGTKVAFGRERPEEALRERAVLEKNQSYPSGHAMGSSVGYGMLGYALILPQRRRPRRVAALLLMLGLTLAIGFSRIYLRAHWFSDVIAGWTIGLAWLFFCIGWLERRRLRILAAHGKQP